MVTKRRSKSIRTEFTAHPTLVDLEDGVQYITKAKIQLGNKGWRSKSMQRLEKTAARVCESEVSSVYC